MRISDWSSDVCSSDLLVKEGGRVEKLSVAVLVNGTYAGDGESRSYQTRGAEEMKKIETLVKSAIGYSEDREDTVQVVNLQFAELPAMVSGADAKTLFGFTPSDLRSLVEVVVMAVARKSVGWGESGTGLVDTGG